MFKFFKKFGFKGGSANTDPPVKDEKKKAEVSEPLNITVHVMPERFRTAAHLARKSKSAGMVILIGGIVLLLVSGGAGYYYIFVKQKAGTEKKSATDVAEDQNKNAPAAEDENIQEEKVAAQKIEDAKKSYLDFKKSLAEAGTLENYERVYASLAGAELLAEWQALKEKIDKLGEDEKEKFLALLKNFRPGAGEIEQGLSGEVSAAGVNLSAGSAAFAITAGLSGDNGNWRLVNESGFEYFDDNNATTTLAEWLSANETPKLPESDIEYIPGSDSDADGLIDKEEAILGTDSASADSDADGYPDSEELNNLYNPAGSGKLTDNQGIKKYSNSSFNYEFLYPAGWSEEKSGGEGVIFRSPDNQFLAMLVQPNADKEDIEAWYLKQFDIASAPAEWKTEKVGPDGAPIWQGVKSPDALTLYVTDADKEYIYVLTYSPGEGRTLDYKNIFEMMIKSFTLF
ncbi:MAG: hypothetical protein WC745_02710 [Patescibacteria group bacterium]|jgi:hypothetical protein